MPSAPFWETSPDSWDQIAIAGTTLPGMVIVSGQGIARKIDVKSSPNRDGARIRDRGYDPAKFDVEVIVWTEQQFSDLLPTLEGLQPKRRGGERQPVDVSHPALSMLGIRSMYVEAVGMPQVKGGKLHITIKAIEWVTQPRERPSLPDPRVLTANAWATTLGGRSGGGDSAFAQYERARTRPGSGP